MSGQRSLPKRWHVSAGRNRKVRKTNPSYYMPLPLPPSLFLLCSNIMTFTPFSPLPCVYDGEDDEEEIILSGCKLVIMAAKIIGTRHRRTRQRRTALFRVRHSVESIYRGMGDKYFRRAYRMNYESFCNLHDKLEDGIELFRLKSRGYNKKVDAPVETIPFHQRRMGQLHPLCDWHVLFVFLLGEVHTISWGSMGSLIQK